MNSEQTKLDKFLGKSLKSYSEAEPRICFESRIIANLRVTPAQPWWRLKLAYASAAIVMVCAMCYGVHRLASSGPEIAPPQMIANRVPAPELVRSGPRVVSTVPVRGRTQRVQVRRNECEQQRVTLASQLPATMPLTQQEKLLLAFARENPNELASTVIWQERMRAPAEQPTVSDRGEQQ